MPRSTLEQSVGLHFSSTGLSPSMVQLSSCLRLSYLHHVSDCPQPQNPKILVWALSRSLAATKEIDFSFSSYRYLDVSVPCVPHIYLCIQYMLTRHNSSWVSPFGNLRIIVYLQLPEAYRSLSRPSSVPSAKASTLRS